MARLIISHGTLAGDSLNYIHVKGSPDDFSASSLPSSPLPPPPPGLHSLCLRHEHEIDGTDYNGKST